VDGSINPAAASQLTVCRVDDSIDVEGGDVCSKDRDVSHGPYCA
jgi:hypothetical protein